MTEFEKKMCEDLWNEFEPDIRSLCMSQLNRNIEDTNDVIAETYLSLCKHISTEGPLYYPKGWIYKTAKNIINKKFREKYKNSQIFTDIDTEKIVLPYQYDFVDDLIKNETLEQISQEIQNLNEKEQFILKYSYIEKHKTKEIAELLGSTETAVKQKRYRIVNKFRKIFHTKKSK